MATPQIRIRKLCAKVIHCSKWLIAELHGWAKRYSWEKLIVTPSEKFLIVTWPPSGSSTHPSSLVLTTGKQFIISHFLAGVWSLKTNIARPCMSCPSKLGGFFEVIRWQTDFVAGSTPGKFLCNGYNFITIPITCTEAHLQSPLHRHYLTHANNHITLAVAAFFLWKPTLSLSSLACDGRNVSKIRI